MTTPTDRPPLSPAILSLLASLRRRIRIYVFLEGLSLAVIWLGFMFWAGLAIDYLPVLAGASEMPQWARAALLALVGAVLAMIVYRWIVRRLSAPLANPSMALLLERRFDRFADALVTAVEMGERPDHAADFHRGMLACVNEEAASKLRGIRLFRIFNLPPLAVRCGAAALLILSAVLFYAADAQAFEIWMRRFALLSDQPWPRSAHIELAGVQVEPPSFGLGSAPPARLLLFQEGVVKVGKGAHVNLIVRADTAAKVVPDTCTIHYRTADQERGRVPMRKTGRPRDGRQVYQFDGKPFKSVLSDIRFDVVGYDHRVRDRQIDVVDNPVVVNPTAYCVFPAYMVDQRLSSWLPHTVTLDNTTKLPQGTELTIRAESNKPLREVRLYNPDTRRTATAEIQGAGDAAKQFEYHVPRLDSPLTLEVTLRDADDVLSPRPHRIHVDAIIDQPPAVSVVLHGISAVVTPDVLVPVRGEIRDDYGVAEAWFEVRLNDDSPRRYPVDLASDGKLESQIDFREKRSGTDSLQLHPGGKLTILVKASDKFDLSAEPHVGSGDPFQLDVVTPDELLARLEARELGLRQRFELMIDELTEMRDSLIRVKSELEGGGEAGAEPEDAAPRNRAADVAAGGPPTNQETAEQRAQTLRRLRVQQAQRQSEKSAQEILGVAAAFQDIRQELINNRIDTEDRKQRLQQQIADPLQDVGEIMFPELNRRLASLETATADLDASAELAAAAAAVEQADDILVQLDHVLQRMLELETFNELVGIVRSLIQDQQTLLEKTKQLRKKQALDFLQPAGEPDR